MALGRMAGPGGTGTGHAGNASRNVTQSQLSNHRSRPDATALRADRGFREQVRRIHRLGPRPVGELLAELLDTFPQAAGPALERLDRYAALDRETVARLGGDDWLEPAIVVRLVAGQRP